MKIGEKMTQTMGTLIVLLSTGMWGISGVCGQYLFEHTQIDSTWLIAVRQILAGLMYMMVIVQRGKEPLFAIFRAQRQTLWEMLFFTLGLLGSQYGFIMPSSSQTLLQQRSSFTQRLSLSCSSKC